MDKKVEAKIRRLTQNQAKALQAIITASNLPSSTATGAYISTASGIAGNALGGTVSALERNGTIQPFGKVGRQFNWELTDPDLIQANKDDKEELLSLIDKIAG